MHASCESLAAWLIAAVAPWSVMTAAAAPTSQSTGLLNPVAPAVETVDHHQSRRDGYWDGYGGGEFVGAGLRARAFAGGNFGTRRPYGYYGYGRGYAYPPSPADAYRPGHPYEFDRQLCCRD